MKKILAAFHALVIAALIVVLGFGPAFSSSLFSTIQFRRGTAAAWTAADNVLAVGEPGYETDTGKFKVGDGLTHWTDLDYIPYSIPDLVLGGITGDNTGRIQDFTFGSASYTDNGYFGYINDELVVRPFAVDVRDFMDGVAGRPTLAQWLAAQATTAIDRVWQAAIDFIALTGGEVRGPDGISFFENGVIVPRRDIVVKGVPGYNTKILFNPLTDNNIAFDFRYTPDNTVQQARVGMQDIWIYSTDSDRSGKIGVQFYVVTDGWMKRVKVHQLHSTDNTSEGWRLVGHDSISVDDCRFTADIPWHIMVNPLYPGYEGDYVEVNKVLFIGTDYTQTIRSPHPTILADNNVHITRFLMTNVDLIQGSTGFRWISDAVSASQSMTLINVHREQDNDPAGWFLDIQAYLQNLVLINSGGLTTGNGYRFRKVSHPTLIGNRWAGGAGRIALDMDNTVSHFTNIGSQWDQLSTYNVVGTGRMREVYATGWQAQNFPSNSFYEADISTNYAPWVRTDNSIITAKTQATLDNAATFTVLVTKTGLNKVGKYHVFAVATDNNSTVEGGTVIAGNAGSPVLLDNTANFQVTAADGKLSITRSGTVFTVTNRLGYTIRVGVIADIVY